MSQLHHPPLPSPNSGNPDLAIIQSALSRSNHHHALYHLPALSPDIPGTVYLDRPDALNAFVRQLFDAGLIDLSQIPEQVTRTDQLLASAISAWFDWQLGNLRTIQFSLAIMDPATVGTQFSQYQFNRQNLGGFFLALIGADSQEFVLCNKAPLLEQACEGLFQTALDALQQAILVTGLVQGPFEIFDMVTFRLWEMFDRLPEDSEVIDFLKEYHTDDPDDESSYADLLPGVLLPELGGHWCWSASPRKKLLCHPYLALITDHHPDVFAREVARQTRTLLAAVAVATENQAKLPNLADIQAVSVYPGCRLLYQTNHEVFSVIDRELEYAMDSGDGTELLGLAEMPPDAADLTHFFAQMALACTVLVELDKLISLISDPADPAQPPI